MNVLLWMIAVLMAVALQSLVPSLWWLGGLRLELLPALVVYAALTLRRGTALWIAVVAGFGQDALSAGPFGMTALVYGGAALLMTALGDALDSEQPWGQMTGGALTAVAVSWNACG